MAVLRRFWSRATGRGILFICGLGVIILLSFYFEFARVISRNNLRTVFKNLAFVNLAMPTSDSSHLSSSLDKPKHIHLVLESNRTPYFYKSVTRHQNDKFKKENTYNLSGFNTMLAKSEKRMKKIVYYNPAFWWMPWWCEQGVKYCPISSCSCFHGHKHITEADGVIFDAISLKDPVPPARKKEQIWIFYGLEPPAHFKQTTAYSSRDWRSRFNWTMTYRLDSDIVTPYNVLLRQKRPANKDYMRIVSEKTKHGLIFVSNCHSESKRETYVKELSKYYPVDTFGKCGQKRRRDIFNVSTPEVQRRYRFYLAFENSFCDDYATEKVFKVYTRYINLIPIVRGGADYRRFLPDGTYINTADFRSPKELAAHLKYLETNVTAYIDILRKKDEYIEAGHRSNFISSFCDVCIKLHNVRTFANHYPNIVDWIQEGTCHDDRLHDISNVIN